MATWIDIGSADDFPPGSQVCTKAGDQAVVVMNVDGQFHACSNVCPHAGLPLGEGERRGKILTCPFHGYTYNIETGQNVDFPELEPPVRIYPVRTTEDRRIEVDIERPAM